MRAALLHQPKMPLVVDDVTPIALRADQLRIHVDASGVCHSDLHTMNMDPLPLPMPVIMGHEGAGTVIEVGAHVTRVRPGDRVVAALFPVCGNCFHCARGETNLCEHVAEVSVASTGSASSGEPVYGLMGLGSFAELMTLSEPMVVRVETDLPAAQLSLLGCGFTTGVGAALWTAKVTPGASVAVFGCGGVGQAVIQGARVAGAAHIYAVDPAPLKRKIAETVGATIPVDPADGDPVEQILAATRGRGTDFSFEVTGRVDVTNQAIAAVRKHGTVVIIGGSDAVTVSLPSVMDEKTIKCSLYGSAQVRHHIPLLIDLIEAGRLDVASMVSQTIGLEDVNSAFEAMLSGEVIRTVIVP